MLKVDFIVSYLSPLHGAIVEASSANEGFLSCECLMSKRTKHGESQKRIRWIELKIEPRSMQQHFRFT